MSPIDSVMKSGENGYVTFIVFTTSRVLVMISDEENFQEMILLRL